MLNLLLFQKENSLDVFASLPQAFQSTSLRRAFCSLKTGNIIKLELTVLKSLRTSKADLSFKYFLSDV